MIRIIFPPKMWQNLLLVLSVYLFCCHSALSQQLATEEDFAELDVTTSADGRYSVSAENEYLEPGGSQYLQSSKVFLHDSTTNTTSLIYTGTYSVITYAELGPIISSNGKFIAFRMTVNGREELYQHNIDSGETTLVSADGTESLNLGGSTNTNLLYGVSMGSDGRYISYLRSIRTCCGRRPIISRLYLYDSIDGSLNLVNESSVSEILIYSVDMSFDGKYVSYGFYDSSGVTGAGLNGYGVSIYDANNRANTVIESMRVETFPELSENGRYVRFSGEIYDRITGEIYPFGISTECIDIDGDGWGFNEYLGASCNVEQLSESACDYSSADLYDGWGWNSATSQSCAPLDNVVNTEPTAQCIDSDGDGFGWDGTASCIPESTTPVTNPSTNSNCDYSDAALYGGWGWNATANQSCAPLETVVVTQPTAQCIDTDGDGWGWDGSASCRP